MVGPAKTAKRLREQLERMRRALESTGRAQHACTPEQLEAYVNSVSTADSAEAASAAKKKALDEIIGRLGELEIDLPPGWSKRVSTGKPMAMSHSTAACVRRVIAAHCDDATTADAIASELAVVVNNAVARAVKKKQKARTPHEQRLAREHDQAEFNASKKKRMQAAKSAHQEHEDGSGMDAN